MNETIRTTIYAGAAALAALLAFASRPSPRPPTGERPNLANKELFPDFKDALAAKSLEIQYYDEANARKSSFRVEEQANGVWTIPSHGGYPADAASQLKNVSQALSGLTVLDVASTRASDHELYGVKDPT